MSERFLRRELLRFAEAMETRLRQHDKKKGQWSETRIAFLFDRLHQNVGELALTMVHNAPDALEIEEKATDIANLAMMVADNARLEWPLKAVRK